MEVSYMSASDEVFKDLSATSVCFVIGFNDLEGLCTPFGQQDSFVLPLGDPAQLICLCGFQPLYGRF